MDPSMFIGTWWSLVRLLRNAVKNFSFEDR